MSRGQSLPAFCNQIRFASHQTNGARQQARVVVGSGEKRTAWQVGPTQKACDKRKPSSRKGDMQPKKAGNEGTQTRVDAAALGSLLFGAWRGGGAAVPGSPAVKSPVTEVAENAPHEIEKVIRAASQDLISTFEGQLNGILQATLPKADAPPGATAPQAVLERNLSMLETAFAPLLEKAALYFPNVEVRARILAPLRNRLITASRPENGRQNDSPAIDAFRQGLARLADRIPVGGPNTPGSRAHMSRSSSRSLEASKFGPGARTTASPTHAGAEASAPASPGEKRPVSDAPAADPGAGAGLRIASPSEAALDVSGVSSLSGVAPSPVPMTMHTDATVKPDPVWQTVDSE